MTDLWARTQQFIDDDVDASTQAELAALLARAGQDAAAEAELADRMSGPLEFGTAGLRGVYQAGESRMNRAVVIRATYGLIQYLLATIPEAVTRGVVIGRDGRRGSLELQRDAAEVVAALGVRVYFLSGTSPTPLVAHAVKQLGAAAGIQVTASHNPPEYNGYKVYWENGAQIIPPVDAGIAAQIAASPPARKVRRLPLAEGRAKGLVFEHHAEAAYLSALAQLRFVDAPVEQLVVAYSALHGVGEALFQEAMRRRGFRQVHSVAEQAQPDGRFPTVRFPNPEEPGALDLVLALAEAKQADLVVVNDPDADRLGAAVRHEGRYVVLGGNDIGVLLASHLVAHHPGGPERLFMATIVSSQLLRKMAADLDVRYAETLTGFKWIANEGVRLEAEGARFVFGYEEALGYTIGPHVRDKDGIGAALVLGEMAALAKAEGRTLLDVLESIRRRHGVFVSRQKSLTLPGSAGLAKIRDAMKTLRAKGLGVLPQMADLWDLDAGTFTDPAGQRPRTQWKGDVLIYGLIGGGRISVRPSGTEPKIKFYLEVAEIIGDGETVAVAQARGEKRLDELLSAIVAASGL